MERKHRTYRLQVNLSEVESQAVDEFQFRERLPNRAAAVRELLQRRLAKGRQETQTEILPGAQLARRGDSGE
jgi:hypothetical protein